MDAGDDVGTVQPHHIQLGGAGSLRAREAAGRGNMDQKARTGDLRGEPAGFAMSDRFGGALEELILDAFLDANRDGSMRGPQASCVEDGGGGDHWDGR